MSRRRESYRPYVGPTDDELHDARYDRQQRCDRAHLTLLPPRGTGEPSVVPVGQIAAAALIGATLLWAVSAVARAISEAGAWLAGVLP